MPTETSSNIVAELFRPITAALALAISVVGYFLRDLHARFERHVDDSDVRRDRLTRLEALSETTDRALRQIGEDMRRMDAKLDRLVERSWSPLPGLDQRAERVVARQRGRAR